MDEIIAAIEKKMRSLDRKARRCEKRGDQSWTTLCYGRILGLIDARQLIIEQQKKDKEIGSDKTA